MTAQRIEAMLRPGSIAIVGASETAGSIGDVLCRNLREGGFGGPVYLVNPRHTTIAGAAVYPDVLSLPQPVDLAVIASPAATVAKVLEECGVRGVRGAVIISAGFREAGNAGATLEHALLETAQRFGVRVLGPNSLGVLRTDIRLNAACGGGMPAAGRLALVSQSSALCAATLDWARTRHVGFSTVISTGVGADVGFAEVLDFLARDTATDGIMLYLEAVGDARRFMSALRAAARVKPVVVMKAGRSLDARGSVSFHTGALVGGDDVFDAAMRRAGVLRIRSLNQLFSAASTLGAGVRLRGRRIAVVTNAGGPAQLAADRMSERWLELTELDTQTLDKLRALLPPSATEGNPVYVRGDATAGQFAEAARLCLDDANTDAVLAILTPFSLTDVNAFAAELIAAAQAQRKPVFTCWMGGEAVTVARQRFAESRIPTFQTPEVAVDAIAALALFTSNQEQLLQVPAPLGVASAPDRATAQQLLDAARVAGNEWLNPADSKALLAAFGIPVVHSRPSYSAAEAVRDGYENMLRDVAIACPDARLEGVLVEPMYVERHGRELMIGAVRDPVFGPAISFGLGGTMVEVIRDRAVALPPLNHYLARDLIRRTRASLALQPLRGAPAAAQDAIEDILLRVSDIVCELPDVGAIDINPIIVTARGAIAVDARIGVMLAPQAQQRQYRHMAIHPYPSALECRLELADGQAATMRAIRPEDAGLERDFVHRLSEQSRFLRFMFGLQELTPAMLSKFTQIDYDRELALIVVLRSPGGAERQIGVARYIALPDEETCEFAIVVSDEWQGRGVARPLFQKLMHTARERGMKVMLGFTLRENSRMIDLARSLGFTTRADNEEPELVRMTLSL